jgi:sialic acid synthase SpsE
MATLSSAFGVPVGYSDHTVGNDVALAAVALGACILEKHLTLDKTLPGPDHAASSEPDEMEALVRSVRIAESALGTGQKRVLLAELDTAIAVRKSVAALDTIPAETTLTSDHLCCVRPGTGLPPAALTLLVGRRTRARIEAGQLISLSDLW